MYVQMLTTPRSKKPDVTSETSPEFGILKRMLQPSSSWKRVQKIALHGQFEPRTMCAYKSLED